MLKMLGRDLPAGAVLRAAVFLGLSSWLDATWFRTVQGSGLVARQDPSSPVLHLLPYMSVKIGSLTTAAGLTVLLAWFDGRSLAWCGVPLQPVAARRFGQGAITAIASFSSVMAVLAVAGAYSVHGRAEHGFEALWFALGWAVLFAMIALQEELVFRGYALMTLGRPLGFWPAAVVTSCWFGYSHAGNAFENWQSELLLAVFALSGCLIRKLTGSLWFLVGFHMLWDYVESIVFSVPDSGLISVGRLLSARLSGDPALTGGAVGPEASPITVAVDVLVLAAVGMAFRKRRPRSGNDPDLAAADTASL